MKLWGQGAESVRYFNGAAFGLTIMNSVIASVAINFLRATSCSERTFPESVSTSRTGPANNKQKNTYGMKSFSSKLRIPSLRFQTHQNLPYLGISLDHESGGSRS